MRPVGALGAILLAVAALGGCAHVPDAPEPSITVKTVTVTRPIPCPALAALGPEPVYADNEQAVASARTIGEAAALYVTGRHQRVQRLTEYAAAAAACVF